MWVQSRPASSPQRRGRLSLAAKEPDQATQYFQKALAVEGASEKARAQAQQGLEQTKQ